MEVEQRDLLLCLASQAMWQIVVYTLYRGLIHRVCTKRNSLFSFLLYAFLLYAPSHRIFGLEASRLYFFTQSMSIVQSVEGHVPPTEPKQ